MFEDRFVPVIKRSQGIINNEVISQFDCVL
jgi:hypothetical protein